MENKTNFNIINIFKDEKIIDYNEFLIIKSLIENFEESIFLRRGNYIKLDMRYLFEAIWGLTTKYLEKKYWNTKVLKFN